MNRLIIFLTIACCFTACGDKSATPVAEKKRIGEPALVTANGGNSGLTLPQPSVPAPPVLSPTSLPLSRLPEPPSLPDLPCRPREAEIHIEKNKETLNSLKSIKKPFPIEIEVETSNNAVSLPSHEIQQDQKQLDSPLPPDS